MYNRYVRNDAGVYRRVSAEETSTTPHSQPTGRESPHTPPPDHGGSTPLSSLLGKNGLVSGILGKFKLDEIDTGDLLLLVILFLLFRDGEDEELLIALGLLLIL